MDSEVDLIAGRREIGYQEQTLYDEIMDFASTLFRRQRIGGGLAGGFARSNSLGGGY